MSPRTPRQYEEIRTEKRNLIMDVALVQFAREGYHNTTISRIARNAGISKGLMYNYFTGKEELLSEILNRSAEEISRYFDPDRDGYLTEEEFVLFIRKLCFILKEKVLFWRFFYQFLMQKDVREEFLNSHIGKGEPEQNNNRIRQDSFVRRMIEILKDYFERKRERKPSDYDPLTDMNMFLYTIEGFGMSIIFRDEIDESHFSKTVESIIERYK